jgi:Putative metallopeptidase
MFVTQKISKLICLSSLAFSVSGLLVMSLFTGNTQATAHKINNTNQNIAIEKDNAKSTKNLNGLLKVSYENSRDANSQKILEYLKKGKRYELLATTINKRVGLPRDIKVVAKDCGFINAFYQEQDHSITMCNEFASYTFNIFKKKGLSEKQALMFTENALSFIFFHESGHMVIHELNLPITGKEEDVADQFSVFVLTKSSEYKQIGPSMIASAAAFFELLSKERGEKVTDSQLMDVHSLDKQRFFSLVCSLYIQDPDTYASAVTKLGYSSNRLRECRSDSQRISRSFGVMLKPYLKLKKQPVQASR